MRTGRSIAHTAAAVAVIGITYLALSAFAPSRDVGERFNVGTCNTCYTKMVGDKWFHNFGGGVSLTALPAGSRRPGEPTAGRSVTLAGPLPYRCEDCHEENQENVCSMEHVVCGDSEEEQQLSLSDLERLYGFVVHGDLLGIEAMAASHDRVVLNHERGAVQVLDCHGDHVIAHLPVSSTALVAIND